MSTSTICASIRRMLSCFQPADHARPDREELVPLFAAANSVDETQSWASSPLKTKEDLLLFAAACNEIALCKDLIAKGVDVNKAKEPNFETPLMWAAKQGHLEIVKLLVEAKAKPDAKNIYGSTPLMYAAFNGDLALCTYLIQEAQVDVLARDKDNETALNYALQGGEGARPVVSLLRDALAQKAAKTPTLIGSLVVNDTPGPESLIADFLGEKELARLTCTSKGFQTLERQSKVYTSTVKIYPKQGNIQQALQKYLKKDDQSNFVPNTTIYKLDLSECEQLTDKDLQFVATFFPDLKVLNLFGCSNLGRSPLQSLPLLKLQHLNLTGCNLINNGLVVLLQHLPNLQNLNLGGGNRITNAGLAYLQPLPNLKYLDLSQSNRITNDGLACLQYLPNLQHLSLSGCKLITDVGLAHLQHLPNLQHLSLAGCNLTDVGLALLKYLPNLQHLDLRLCHLITDDGLALLQHLRNLQHLDLRLCHLITDDGLALLKYLPNLQHLDLSFCNCITNVGLALLQPLLYLKYLSLEGCTLTNDSLALLQPLRNLQYLSLERGELITDVGLVLLQPLLMLRYLNLTGCYQITDVGLALLQPLRNLQHLNLKGCYQITDVGLEYLQPLLKLRYLNLTECYKITYAACKARPDLMGLFSSYTYPEQKIFIT